MVEQHIAHGDGIVFAEVLIFSKHDTLHAEIERLAGGVGHHSSLLVEMAQLASIVGHANLELIAQIAFRILYLGTVTVWAYLLDFYFLAALDAEFKDGSDRLLVARTSHVNSGLLDNQFLGIGSHRCQQQYG